MSTPLNDIGFSDKKTPLSMKEIVGPVRQNLASKRCQSARTECRIDEIADRLVRKFNAPGSRAFYCDCARHLTQDFIERAIESAFRPKVLNPPAYFGRICTNELVKLGIYA